MRINNGNLSRNYDIFDYFETKISRNSDYINDSMTKGISFSAELFTERNPCTACGKTIKKFQNNVQKRFIDTSFKVYSLFGNDRTFYDVYNRAEYDQMYVELRNKLRSIMVNGNENIQFYEFKALN